MAQFPYTLLGLSHPVTTKSRAWGRSLAQHYDRQPQGLRDQGHGLTKKFWDPGVLRSQLDRFISDGVLGNKLADEIGAMRFIPFSDRFIEAEHVYLSAVARSQPGTFRGVRFSAAHRFKMLAERLHDPDFRHALVTHITEFTKSRYDPRVFIRALGLENHPVLHDVCNQNRVTQAQWSLKERYETRRLL